MPYPTQFVRINWLFTDNGSEMAETGLNFGSTVGTPADFLSVIDGTLLESLADSYYHNLIEPADVIWGSYSRLVGMRAALIGTDGRQVGEPVTWTATSPHAGTNTNVMPQCSVVLSLRTDDRHKGPANLGRMYLPHTMFNLVTNHSYAVAATVADFTTDAATFLNDVNEQVTGLGGMSGTSAIISNISAKGSGIKKEVTRVLCAEITDTQRRRYGNLEPNYHEVALTFP